MKNPLRCAQLVGLTAVLALVVCISHVRAGEAAPAAAQKTFDKLLGAIKKADLDAFVADGNEAVKKGTTQTIMDDLKTAVGTRLDKGYKATYLCQLKQAGHQVYMWKVTFTDDGDDIVVRLAMKDGKVGGFFFQ